MSLIRNAANRARVLPTRGGTWHPDAGGATIWQTGKRYETADGGVIYPKTMYPPRYYKFGYEKLTNPDDPYDSYLPSMHMDGVTYFKPEYKLFQGQQRRRPNLGFKSGKMAPRFCFKNPEKMFNVWHTDDSFVFDHMSVYQRLVFCIQTIVFPCRIGWWCPFYTFFLLKCIVCQEKRREPVEIFIDREEYFRNWQTVLYGIYFDHHKYSHMLSCRRANKWHYDNVDLLHGHH